MLTNFCCCCNLRTGCIVLAWLQIMGIMIVIPSAVSPLVLLNPESETRININIGTSNNYWYTGYNNWKTRYYEILQPCMSLLIAELVMKAITCVALIIGAVKRNHMFMQPWIFLQCFESVILSLGFIGLFVTSCFIPILFSVTILCAIIAALHWYFWTNIRCLYLQDKVPPFIMWGIPRSNHS
ncbi:hypothetical protein CBL_10782 [Carabus blaptoides fortunei]